jgi:predicted thioesterase
MALEPGLSGSVSTVVVEDVTALALGTGSVHSLATPAMIALMEAAAMRAVADDLQPGQSTVGSHVDITHLAPSRVGLTVTATATVTEVEGRRLIFSVSAVDDGGIVGRGTHERVVVDLPTFEEKIRRR